MFKKNFHSSKDITKKLEESSTGCKKIFMTHLTKNSIQIIEYIMDSYNTIIKRQTTE